MIAIRVYRKKTRRDTRLEMGDENLQTLMDRANREFGNPDRDLNPYIEYELRKSAWLREHPDTTPEEITRAFRAIADDLGI